jgi:hypothetical protein
MRNSSEPSSPFVATHRPGQLISVKQVALLVFPAKLAQNPLSPNLSHTLAAFRVVQEGQNRPAEPADIAPAPTYTAAPSAVIRVSARSKATTGFPLAMFSPILTNVERRDGTVFRYDYRFSSF